MASARSANGADQKQTREIRQFLGWAYWIVGAACFTWETNVFVTVNRPSSEVELPFFGKCVGSEALIYTLTFFWVVLLILHLIVLAHQSWAQRGSFSAQFPGVLGDKEIPKPLGVLRVLLFVVLVAWPTALHVFHTFRTFDHMAIVLKKGSEVYPGAEFGGWKAFAVSRPKENGNPVSGEWRWLHWRDKKPIIDGTGNPIPGKYHIDVWVSAVPILQPYGFAIVAAGFTVSLGYQIIRAIRRRKPSDRP